MEKISVIIPVYNGEKFMKNTIAQLKAQTFYGWKCYLIDDKSKDDSVKIIEREIEGDDRFVLIKNEKNIGKPKALNKGLDIVQGEYVLMLDDDDEYTPTMFEDLYNRANGDGLDFSVCNIRKYDIKTKSYSKPELEFVGFDEKKVYDVNSFPSCGFFLDELYATVWNKLFKREFINSNGLRFKNYFPCDDMLFAFEAILVARKIGIINKVLLTWNVNRSESGSGAKSLAPKAKNIFSVIEIMDKKLHQVNLWSKYENVFVGYVVGGVFGYDLGQLSFTEWGERFFDDAKKVAKRYENGYNGKSGGKVDVFMRAQTYDEYLKNNWQEARNIIEYNEAKVAELEAQVRNIKNSRSYKIGQTITAPIRWLKKCKSLA